MDDVASAGPTGPRGPEGPAGPPGPRGAAGPAGIAAPTAWPHWTTLLIGVIGPALTLGALYFTYQTFKTAVASLATSRASLEISQRAYITIQNTRLSIVNNNLRRDILNVTKRPKDTRTYVAADVSFTIANLGNTPAKISDIELRFDVGDGWEIDLPEFGFKQQGNSVFISSTADIGPKDSVTKRVREGFILSDRERDSYNQAILNRSNDFILQLLHRGPMQVQAKFTYTDVFDVAHDVAWCSALNYISEVPFPCE